MSQPPPAVTIQHLPSCGYCGQVVAASDPERIEVSLFNRKGQNLGFVAHRARVRSPLGVHLKDVELP